ncbi:hypothetical protein [Arcticibacter sp. MXS-1]|uniref:hypothetical protein n=1 Tax=Arcticibacter sp. MXS-1 TaxID=3341726 RepID=UPI0035A8C9E5
MNRTTPIIKISVLILAVCLALTGCGNKRKKIRLHARDTTGWNVSGSWILTDSSTAKMKKDSILPDSLRITKLALNADHSARLYPVDSNAQKKPLSGQWEFQKHAEAPGVSSIILLTRKNAGDTIRLNVVYDEAVGDTLLHDRHSFSYHKSR